MITINNSLFSKYTYSKIHCLYASKKEYMLKDICTESINIIYVQLYANYYVKQILSNIISIISFHIAPAPNNDSPPCKTSCCSSNHFQESLKKERKKERKGTSDRVGFLFTAKVSSPLGFKRSCLEHVQDQRKCYYIASNGIKMR